MSQSQNSKSEWQIVPSGTTNTLTSTYFTSIDDGWAVGNSGTILHYENQNWELQTTGLGESINFSAVHFPNSTKGWAVGAYELLGSPYGMIAHYNGTSWEWQLINEAHIAFTDVYFIDPSHGWAVGWRTNNGTESIYYFNGLDWSEIENPLDISIVMRVYFADYNHGWFLGFNELVQYSDSTFTVLYENPNCDFRDFYVKDSNNIWIVGNENPGNETLVYYYNGDSVSLQSSTNIGSLASIYFSDYSEGYVVGSCFPDWGNRLRYLDGNWQVESCFLGSEFFDIIAVENNWWSVGLSGAIAYKYSDTITSIKDISSPHDRGIEVYPNPISDYINIDSQEKDVVGFSLYSSMHSLLKSGYLYPGINRIIMSDFKRGLYFLHVDDNRVFKIIKI